MPNRGNNVNITITLTKDMVEQLDRIAEATDRSRSQVVRMLIRQHTTSQE